MKTLFLVEHFYHGNISLCFIKLQAYLSSFLLVCLSFFLLKQNKYRQGMDDEKTFCKGPYQCMRLLVIF